MNKQEKLKYIIFMSTAAASMKFAKPLSLFSKKAKIEAVSPVIAEMIRGIASYYKLSISIDDSNEYAKGFVAGVGPYKLLQSLVSHSFGLMGGFVISNPALKMLGGDAILYYFFGKSLDLTISSNKQFEDMHELLKLHSKVMQSTLPKFFN